MTPPTPAPATARGQRTRARLLEAAADLIAERGYHAVAMADLGAAAGVTGSAIYRHFASKQDLLVAVLDRVVGRLLDGARAVVAAAPHPATALDGLVAAHVDFALADRALIRVYDQEADQLPGADRRRIRATMRAYADEWVRALRAAEPDLASETARAAVHATFGLLNSVADYRSGLTDSDLRALLVTMARRALAAATVGSEKPGAPPPPGVRPVRR